MLRCQSCPVFFALPIASQQKWISGTAMNASKQVPRSGSDQTYFVSAESCHKPTCTVSIDHLVGAQNQRKRDLNA